MKNLGIIHLIILLVMLFFSSSLWANGGAKACRSVVGTIIMTGNEPFTGLSIQVNDSLIYKLKCGRKTEKLLLKNQGRNARIYFRKKTKKFSGLELRVIRVMFIENSLNNKQ